MTWPLQAVVGLRLLGQNAPLVAEAAPKSDAAKGGTESAARPAAPGRPEVELGRPTDRRETLARPQFVLVAEVGLRPEVLFCCFRFELLFERPSVCLARRPPTVGLRESRPTAMPIWLARQVAALQVAFRLPAAEAPKGLGASSDAWLVAVTL